MAWLDYISKFGALGTGNGQFTTPYGVDVDATYIYVADTYNSRIQIFDKAATHIATFGVQGAGVGQLGLPRDIAVDANYIYVIDSYNNKVLKYNKPAPYAFVTEFGTVGTGNGQFTGPYGLAVDADRIYIADTDNHRIQIFDKISSAHIISFGVSGTGNGQFSSPCSIAVNATDIYVADTGNNRIQVFDKTTYAYNSKLGRGGSNDGQFSGAFKVKVDAHYIYTIDVYHNRVQIFSLSTKAFIQQFGSYYKGNGQLKTPFKVVANGAYLYVLDTYNHRVMVFNKVAPYLFIGQFGTFGTGNGQFGYPSGISIYGNSILIADSNNNRIQEFDKNTFAYIGQFGTAGIGPGQFSAPRGVAVDADNIYVADTAKHRIQIFSRVYGYVSGFGSPMGAEAGLFNIPFDIAVDATYIYVVDSNNHRVQVFNKTSPYAFVGQFGTFGTGNGQFNYPRGVTVDDYIYVADTSNNRVQIFHINTFAYIGQFGVSGTIDGQFTNPIGVATDTGRTYVADSYNNRIQEFNKVTPYAFIGKFKEIGSSGSGDGQFNGPSGIAVDADKVFIVEAYNNRIQSFSNTQSIPSAPTELSAACGYGEAYSAPFAPTSIWRRKIPVAATYTDVQDAIWGDPDQTPTQIGVDLIDILVEQPEAPLVNFRLNQGWSYPARATAQGGALFQRHLMEYAGTDVRYPNTANAFICVINPATGVADEAAGAWREPGGDFLIFADYPQYHNHDIVNGDGRTGGPRAATFQILGGCMRAEELNIGIPHALNIATICRRFSSTTHYRWPASAADSFASDPLIGYQGPNPAYTIGTLLAIPRSVDLAALNWYTTQGWNLATCAQEYGWYIGDTSTPFGHSMVFAWERNSAYNDLGLGFNPATGSASVDSSKMDFNGLMRDIDQILHLVYAVNQTE